MPIGEGATSTVWRAWDRYRDSHVALKLFDPAAEVSDARTAAEVIALRRGLPGTVALYDSSVDGARRFLVMELIEGSPFPGCPLPCPWIDLRPVLLALLDTLAGLHAAGIVHRDLKPANVLVDRDGRPVVVDFGIARVARFDAPGITRDGFARGTWRYAAPEQMHGETSPASDLYALGVMVWEALLGAAPFDEAVGPEALHRAKSHGVSSPLVMLDPSLDPAVAAVIERLLAPEPLHRPSSAVEVLRALRGDDPGDLDDRFAAALARLPATAAGAWDEPSLRALFGGRDPLLHRSDDAAAVLYALTRGEASRVRAVVGSWERARAVAGDGPLVVARATLDRHLVDVERDDFSRPDGRLSRAPLPAGLTEAQRDAALHVELLSPSCTPATLALALGVAREVSDALLDALSEAGVVRVAGDRVELVDYFGLAGAAHLSRARAERVYRRVVDALPVGTPGRLRRLIALRADPVEVARECLRVAEDCATEGYLLRAEAALDEATRHLVGARSPGGAAVRDDVLALWTRVALSQRTTRASDVVLYELSRDESPSAVVHNLRRLVRAHQATDNWTDEAWRLASEVEPFDDEDLEVWRCSTLISAARKKSPEELDRRVEEFFAVAQARGTPRWLGRAQFWMGRRHYQRRAYADAAAAYAVTSAADPWAGERIHARVSVASALMEAGELERALGVAEEAVASARERRLAFHEARALWVARGLRYRMDVRAVVPDVALARAAVGVARDQGMLACVNEAAFAWRQGDLDALRALRALHRDVAGATADFVGAPLVEAMAHDGADRLPRAEAERVLDRVVRSGEPLVIIQVAALLGREVAGADDPRIGPHVTAVASRDAALRARVREALSLDECLARLGH